MIKIDQDKSKEELIAELTALRRRVAELESRTTGEQSDVPASSGNDSPYHRLFDASPVALLECDFSAVKISLDQLRGEGVTDLEGYFERRPEVIRHCLALVRVQNFNRTMLELFGAKNKEALFANLNLLYSSHSGRAFKEPLLTIAAGKTRFEGEIAGRTLSGARIALRFIASAAGDQAAGYNQVLISFIDVTKRRQAEEAYRALVDHSLQGLAILGTDGVLFANRAMADILGYSAQELQAMSLERFYETIVPAHRPFMQQRLAAWRQGKQASAGFEIQIIRKDGTRRWIERFGAPVKYQGQRAQQIAIIDITERKNAEEALQQQAFERELLNQAIQVFTATLDIDRVLTQVVQSVQNLLATVGCAIWLIDADRHDLVCRQTNDAWREVVCGARLQPGQGLVGWVAQTGQSLIVADVQADARYANEMEQLGGLTLRSLLSMPLQVESNIIGVIQVGDSRPNYFDDSHLGLIEPLAAAASIAIQNARLFQTAQQVDELRTLNDLDEALSRAILNPAELAEVALGRISAALEAPLSGLWLLSAQPELDPDRSYSLGQGWQPDETGRCRAWCEQYGKGAVPAEVCRALLDLEDPGSSQHEAADGLCLPIASEGNPLAVLILGGRPAGRPFTGRDQALLQAMAGRVVQSFQSSQLYQASQARAAYLTTLHAISATVVSSLELNTVLRQVLELVCRALNAIEGFILLLEQETGALFFAMSLTEKTVHLRGQKLESKQSIVGSVVREGRAVRIGDVRRDARFSPDIDAITGFETRSLVCAPLTYQGQIIGVVEIFSNRPNCFSDEDLALVVAVASIAATALQNARLYAASQARATELAILNEIGLALTSSLDYQVVVRLALSLTRGLFKAERTVLFQAEAATLQPVAIQPLAADGPAGLAVEEKIAEWVFAERLPALIPDAGTDKRLPALAPQALPGPTMMAVPLLTAGHSVGVLTVQRSPKKDIYTLDDLRTLQSVSSVLVMALHNAQLYAEQLRLMREQERTHQHLIQAEKMVALGRLVAAIMHEINNPLQAIHNFLELAQAEAQGDQGQYKLTHYLDIANTEVGRISAIIRRLRDFYSPASEGFRPTNLNDVVAGVLDLTGKQLEQEQIRVERMLEPSLPPIEANADQLRQVFLNFVLNAIDAMPDGGTLQVVTAIGPPDARHAPAPGVVRVEFSDTGKGISPEAQIHIFEPFFTTKTNGSGLGLSISYSIIRAHQGQLSFLSYPGLGTTFTILLPLKRVEGDRTT